AALTFDRPKPQRAVTPGSGQNYANGAFPLLRGKRLEEMVDRHVEALGTGSPDQAQLPILQDHVVIRCQDVNMVWLDRDAVADLQHWHRGRLDEQVGQGTVRSRPEMLNNHES